MIDSLYIAWEYVGFNKMRTATLVACITLISFLPASCSSCSTKANGNSCPGPL